MFTVQLTSGYLTASVTQDGEIHPDLMDEMAGRCLRLFVEANASLPEYVVDGDDAEG